MHARIFKREKELVDAGQPVTPGGLPDVLEIINAPGVVDVCNRLLGKHWAIVPFTHNASFTSGGRDQHWHKDDNGPYNGKKQRHHQAVQIEMLYYPQDVTPEMGPTATVPFSQYLSFDSEENQDNFAGAEHLDFNYQLSRMEAEPVSGPDSKAYSREEIVERRTAHDVRMREAVEDTGWPLVSTLEAAPLRAGSVVFYSHNTFTEATTAATIGTPGKITRALCGASGCIAPANRTTSHRPKWTGTPWASIRSHRPTCPRPATM